MSTPAPPSAPTEMLLPSWLQSLALRAVNHLLGSDPRAPGKLRPHAGKTVVVSAFGIEASCQIGADGLLHVPQQPLASADAADLHITLDRDALRDAMEKNAPLRLSAAQVRGDAELAQTVSWLFAHVRWDLEDDLAQLVGDIAARRLTQAGRSLLDGGRRRCERGQQRARAWFASGGRPLVSREEFAQQQDAVRALRDQAARLRKRIDLLQRRLDATRR